MPEQPRPHPGHLSSLRPGVLVHREGEHYTVDPDSGCWNWLKGKQRGYPWGYAHRKAYEAWFGVKVPKGHDCHHRCENPGCVNPLHIEIIDHPEHLRRHKRALSPLTVEMVREIKCSLDTTRVLAERYGVTEYVIWDIVRGKNWRDVEGSPPPVHCGHCGAVVVGKRHKRYCDKRCQQAFNQAKRRRAAA